MNRRRFLGIAATAAGGGAAAVALGGAGVWLSRPAETGALLPSRRPLPERFQVPLPVPPVLAPVPRPDDPDTDHYEITQRLGRQRILPDVATTVWGYNGSFPGPTIVSRRGRRTVVHHANALPVPTVTHLHGGHTPADSDGFPTDLLIAEHGRHPDMGDPQARVSHGSRLYEYPMAQRAATLWYHDHAMDSTAESVWRGLAGFHLVTDDEEQSLPLPRGDRDIPLMLADRSFDADGSLRYPARTGANLPEPFAAGLVGDVILVNGAPWPVLDVAACRYRFRLLNASHARRYRLRLRPTPAAEPMLVQVGADGGLLESPLAHDSIDIAPAERFDVVVDFARYRTGEQVTLVNDLGDGPAGSVMRFRVGERRPDPSAVPDRLSTVDRMDPARARVTRTFNFQRSPGEWHIDGHPFDPARPIARPRLGDTEIWRFVTDFHHPVHVHLAQFQVVSRNLEAPGPYDAGWKDTVDVRPAEAVEVVLRFDDYPGRYVLHCHNLAHEDRSMMATVLVS